MQDWLEPDNRKAPEVVKRRKFVLGWSAIAVDVFEGAVVQIVMTDTTATSGSESRKATCRARRPGSAASR